VFLQAVGERLVVCGRCRWSIHNHDIQAFQSALYEAKRFPDLALQAIATGRKLTMLFANSQPKSGVFILAACLWAIQDGKHIISTAFRFLENAAERSRVGEPTSRSEAASRK